MSKNYVEPMVVDVNGNIYISAEEYNKDMKELKEKIINYRKSLLHSKKNMERLANKSDTDKESIKALGYIEAINILTKDLKNMIEMYDDSDN